MEIGSIAELLSAFASLLALIAAGVAAWAAVRTSQQQGVQLAHLATAESERCRSIRAAQASQIAAWIELGAGSPDPQLHFANPSGLPIYAVTVATSAGARTSRVTYSVLAPRGSTSRLRRVEEAMLAAVDDGGAAWADLLDAGDLRAALAFRDAHGGWWSRTLIGDLREFASEHDARAALDSAV